MDSCEYVLYLRFNARFFLLTVVFSLLTTPIQVKALDQLDRDDGNDE